MSQVKNDNVSGRDHYALTFRNELDQEAEWLRIGAVEKVNSIEILLKQAGLNVTSVLELGSGTGAVIQECQRRRLGSRFTAVEFSLDALAYLEERSSGIECIHADITEPAFHLSGEFDLVILSHVLEHLEDPGNFLQAIVNKVKFRSLIAEVPLEDLPVSRIKNLIQDRRRNLAGHVQFFTQPSFLRLLLSAGFKMDARRVYYPKMSPEAIDFVCDKDGISGFRRLSKKAIGVHLPRLLGPLWTSLYYAHMAVICKDDRR